VGFRIRLVEYPHLKSKSVFATREAAVEFYRIFLLQFAPKITPVNMLNIEETDEPVNSFMVNGEQKRLY
jgi:hypothetical protein